MQHDHHVRPATQRLRIAGLLIASVAEVRLVTEHRQPKPFRDIDRFVRAEIVNEKDLVDDVRRNVADSPLERPGGVISRKDDNDPLSIQHACGLRQSIWGLPRHLTAVFSSVVRKCKDGLDGR